MADGKTTRQVAEEMGIRRNRILLIVKRHPHLKPAKRVGIKLIWTAQEFQRLHDHISTHKAGRPLGVKTKRSDANIRPLE